MDTADKHTEKFLPNIRTVSKFWSSVQLSEQLVTT